MYIILFHISQSNDKIFFVLMVFDNSTPSLACIFVTGLLSLNSYCSAVSLCKVYGTYTNKLISKTNGFFFLCQYIGGKKTRFERDELQKLMSKNNLLPI